MNVLILSAIEWSDSNAFGNTMSNLFAGMPDLNIASLYLRNTAPTNAVCTQYYKISYSAIAKNLFRSARIGECFSGDFSPTGDAKNQNREKRAITFIHKWKLGKLVYWAEDLLFATKKWDNEKFRGFLQDFAPDVVFSFAKASKTHLLFLETIRRRRPNVKIVQFLVDDIYAARRSRTYEKVIGKQLAMADKLYAITPSLKEEYEKLFSVKFDILRKGCDFSVSVEKKGSEVKTIVYAGNLLYGREQTLIALANAIKVHNARSEAKLALQVYSATLVDEEVKNALNIPGASEFMGPRPYSEIMQILADAAVVLHVESFREDQMQIVKHSFSTKITDCLQSGSALYAIGSQRLASIDEVLQIPGAFVSTDLAQIPQALEMMAQADLYENAVQMRAYALEHFDIQKNREKLYTDLRTL